MLATIPRAAPRAARRLTTATAARAPLAPPYSHAVRDPLAAPYAQHIPEASSSGRLQPAYKYQMLEATIRAPSPAEWVEGVLATDAGRQWAQSAWDAAIADLAETATPPEIPFQALTAVIGDPAMVSLLQRAGSVVVRDVVRDALAEAWAAEMLEARADRSSATYYSEAQLAARADCSVLSTTSQLLRALTGAEESFIRVDSLAVNPAKPTWAGSSLWALPERGTPVNAHLALSRTDLNVPTASAAATYALLRPHFEPKASRISFYSPADYLAPSNWAMRESGADYDATLAHIRPAPVSLAPGDVLVSHAGLPLTAADSAGLVLPVHPLPATDANRAFVDLQRAAFEAGLPPPHRADGVAALEPACNAKDIDSHAGRRAMGYDA